MTFNLEKEYIRNLNNALNRIQKHIASNGLEKNNEFNKDKINYVLYLIKQVTISKVLLSLKSTDKCEYLKNIIGMIVNCNLIDYDSRKEFQGVISEIKKEILNNCK